MAYIDCDKCSHGKVCAYRHQYDDHIVTCSHWQPADGVTHKSGVAKDIEELEKEVGQIYNRYVFEDPDYTEDDVATEAAMNALTEVVNAIDELKKKYTEDMK